MHLRGRSIVLLAAVLAVAPLDAARAAAAAGQIFVPWKVLNPGDEPVRGDLVLHWIPASRDEIRRSPLLTSPLLASYASQCVGMQVVRPDDVILIDKLGASGHLPAAVLTDSSSTIRGSVHSEKGELSTAAVETLVRDTFAKIDADTDKLLDDAKARASAGDVEGAVELYRRVLVFKCLFPRKGRDAEKALRRLVQH